MCIKYFLTIHCIYRIKYQKCLIHAIHLVLGEPLLVSSTLAPAGGVSALSVDAALPYADVQLARMMLRQAGHGVAFGLHRPEMKPETVYS